MSQSKQKNEERLLREIYFQITEGGSPAKIGKSSVWIKHFTFEDQSKIDRFYRDAFNKAAESGIPTRKEALERLIEEGLWTIEEEASVAAIEDRAEKLKSAVAKAVNKTIADAVRSQIEVEQKKLAEKREEKSKLISHTCEDIAERKSNDFVVEISFKKKKNGDSYYDKEEFSLLDRDEILDLVQIYNDAVSDLSSDNIKNIAAADFFVSLFALVEDAPEAFFGERIPDLTFFQINLLSYAKMVANITKNFNPPEHIRNDAGALMAFARSENKKSEKKSKGSNQTPQGLISKKV